MPYVWHSGSGPFIGDTEVGETGVEIGENYGNTSAQKTVALSRLQFLCENSIAVSYLFQFEMRL